MAVEGLKRVYEAPYVKSRVDIVKEYTREPGKERKKQKKTEKKETSHDETGTGPTKRVKKGIIDIRA